MVSYEKQKFLSLRIQLLHCLPNAYDTELSFSSSSLFLIFYFLTIICIIKFILLILLVDYILWLIIIIIMTVHTLWLIFYFAVKFLYYTQNAIQITAHYYIYLYTTHYQWYLSLRYFYLLIIVNSCLLYISSHSKCIIQKCIKQNVRRLSVSLIYN